MGRRRHRKSEYDSDSAVTDFLPTTATLPMRAITRAVPLPNVDPTYQTHGARYADEILPDERRFNPTRAYSGPASTTRSAKRIMATARTYTSPIHFIRSGLQFADPTRVATCVRRNIRKQVLHALGRQNKGRGGSRRRNAYSKIKC